MVDIIHRIGIKSSPLKVYGALSSPEGLAQWWTDDVKGESRIGGMIEFGFRTRDGTYHPMTMEVEELEEHRAVRWLCVQGPAEWVGTEVTFQLSDEGHQTIVLFGHRNWREAVEFTSHCSMKWATFLLSLREFVETGKGRPAPHDLQIDNWN